MTNQIQRRPWPIWLDVYDRCMKSLFPIWLERRGGIVVYENQTMDSSHLGDRTYMPAKFYAQEDEVLHDAPPRIGDVPSRFQEKVDHITLEEFGGELDKALACFVKEDEAGRPTSKSSNTSPRTSGKLGRCHP
jgi:hypothetical protein